MSAFLAAAIIVFVVFGAMCVVDLWLEHTVSRKQNFATKNDRRSR